MDSKLIQKLVVFADLLDQKGLIKEADRIDKIIEETSGQYPEAGLDMLAFKLMEEISNKYPLRELPRNVKKLFDKVKALMQKKQ